jgi:hypothetical protein
LIRRFYGIHIIYAFPRAVASLSHSGGTEKSPAKPRSIANPPTLGVPPAANERTSANGDRPPAFGSFYTPATQFARVSEGSTLRIFENSYKI